MDNITQMPVYNILNVIVSRSSDGKWVIIGAEDDDVSVEWRMSPESAYAVAGAIMQQASVCEDIEEDEALDMTNVVGFPAGT